MSATEKIQLAYDHNTEYTVTPLNTVGATTSTTLRTVTAYTDADCKHVRKFGLNYAIGDITNAVVDTPRSAGGNAWTYEFFGLNAAGAWVSMGSVADTGGASGAFADGSAFAASAVKVVVTPDAGDTISITDGDTITLTTDTDAGGLTVMLSGESMTAAFTIYLATSGSTYYDSALKYGGKRHTPDGTEKYPYFTPQAAYAALGGAFTIVTVLDSEHYVIDEWSVATASSVVQAALGQTPVFCSPIGASVYRDVIHDGNNSDTAYVASTGSDVTGNGKWWTPYATHSAAFAAIGARAYINTQDAATFTENIALSAACTLEPIYGIVPILQATTTANNAIAITHGSISVSGYNITLSNYGIYATGAALNIAGTISFNSCYNNTAAGIYIATITTLSGTVSKNICYSNNTTAGIFCGAITTLSGTVSKNICYNSNVGFNFVSITTLSGTISNNISYNHPVYSGMSFNTINDISGIVSNNVCKFNRYGFNFASVTNQTGTIRENISRDNTSSVSVYYDLVKSGGVATVTYTCYSTNSGVTIGAGCITTDPELCKTTSLYKYGISTLRRALDSTNNPYHTGTSSNSIGIIAHGILLGANDITFNGIMFDGLDSYAHAIYCLATRTGLNLKWCTFQNYIGIAVDIYATAATSAIISNCWFKDNGQALAIPQGSNTISYCIFNNNSKIGIWINYVTNIFNHCVIYNSGYGIYIDTNANITLKNTIIDSNSLYGIYSEISLSPTYICNTDAINSYVDQSSTTNIADAPLMIDPDNNDFHIRVSELGYDIESPCKEIADDGYDIGAYLYEYSVLTDSWKKTVLEFNPKNMNEAFDFKGGIEFEDALGNYSSWAQSTKMVFPMTWGSDSAMSETQRKTLKYIQQKIQRRENSYTAEKCVVRLQLAKDNFYGSGTGTVDATGLTLTDSVAAYFPQDKKGWWASIVFNSQAAAVVDATAKTITKAGAGWTVNAWTGYYFYQNNMYFYILSNTATVLTISDPNNYLTDSASFTAKIIKYFKITENTETVLTLSDPDSELADGSYSYFIDFIKCRVKQNPWEAAQNLYDFATEATKTGITLTLEEVD